MSSFDDAESDIESDGVQSVEVEPTKTTFISKDATDDDLRAFSLECIPKPDESYQASPNIDSCREALFERLVENRKMGNTSYITYPGKIEPEVSPSDDEHPSGTPADATSDDEHSSERSIEWERVTCLMSLTHVASREDLVRMRGGANTFPGDTEPPTPSVADPAQGTTVEKPLRPVALVRTYIMNSDMFNWNRADLSLDPASSIEFDWGPDYRSIRSNFDQMFEEKSDLFDVDKGPAPIPLVLGWGIKALERDGIEGDRQQLAGTLCDSLLELHFKAPPG